jgi:hypothetical protein
MRRLLPAFCVLLWASSATALTLRPEVSSEDQLLQRPESSLFLDVSAAREHGWERPWHPGKGPKSPFALKYKGAKHKLHKFFSRGYLRAPVPKGAGVPEPGLTLLLGLGLAGLIVSRARTR